MTIILSLLLACGLILLLVRTSRLRALRPAPHRSRVRRD
jgi:hypothetical protein